MSLNVKYEKKTEELHCHVSGERNKLNFSAHLHRELELVLYRSGKTLACSDSKRYSLQAGDVFLTFPNQIHSYETFEKEDYSILIVRPDLMPELLDAFELSVPESAVVHGLADDPKIAFLFDCILKIGEEKKGAGTFRSEKLHGYLLALFSEILSHMKLTGLPEGDSSALRSVIVYCTRHYGEDLSLTVLEEKLGLNRYYISHLFSGKLGMKFNDYINSLRVSEACKMLLNSDDSVTDICFHVGFETLRTFNRAFVRHTGKTPSEYRKNGYPNETSQ